MLAMHKLLPLYCLLLFTSAMDVDSTDSDKSKNMPMNRDGTSSYANRAVPGSVSMTVLIIAAPIGGLVLLVGLTVVIIFVIRRRKRKAVMIAKEEETAMMNPESHPSQRFPVDPQFQQEQGAPSADPTQNQMSSEQVPSSLVSVPLGTVNP